MPLVRVELERLEDVAHVLDITAVPSFVLLRDGKKVDMLVGDEPGQLAEKIQKNM